MKLAIIGAGPIGVETAALAVDQGLDVTVFEAGDIGANVAKWGHVKLFSPWSLNRSPWGNARVNREFQGDAFPTGKEYLDTYLKPLAETLNCDVRTGTRIASISRKNALKGEFIANPERASGPFLLHVVDQSSESFFECDAVIDTSGAYSDPARLGPGGLPALGEDANSKVIERYIPDPLGHDREAYANKRTLVVGAGYSAVTSLKLLHELKQEVPGTQISWVIRSESSPYTRIENDSLPQRDALAVFGNDAANGKVEGITPLLNSTVASIQPAEDGVEVEIWQNGHSRTFVVDRIVSNVGYRPDAELNRELQFHQCYASEGPMKLAASLLAASGGADCLTQTSAGVDVLKSPEPNYYVLGAKSYGRNSAFLMKLGFDQAEEVVGELKRVFSD